MGTRTLGLLVSISAAAVPAAAQAHDHSEYIIADTWSAKTLNITVGEGGIGPRSGCYGYKVSDRWKATAGACNGGDERVAIERGGM